MNKQKLIRKWKELINKKGYVELKRIIDVMEEMKSKGIDFY